ncbi:MAG: DUF4080 domain-containing protein, partial [Firmicutes bacterium]|nr:DUF4080 domain-containing protein [Bacillota bacterium]
MILLITLNAHYVHTALALYTLQAYCRKDLPDLEVMEFNINQSLDWILGEIYRKNPRILGISTNIWNITASLELVDRVKKVRPETVVILGGPEATADYAAILQRPGAPDFIVLGEGEETFRQLLLQLERGQADYASIDGLAWRQEGQVQRTPDRPPIDPATIPFPYPDLSALRHRILYYEASRGCPFRCTYCLSGWEETKLRTLPLDRVKADLKRFIAAGARTVKLIDRTFNLDRRRAATVLQFLLEQGGATEFHFELVGELLDEELIRLLKTAPAGRFRVEIGVQSTCAAALKAVRRDQNLAVLRANCLALTAKESGLDQPRPLVHLDLIAGLPYEDLATFGRSFDWTFRLHPDELQLGFLKLLKGSPLRARAGEYGYTFTATPPYEILGNKWLSYADLLVLKGVEEMVEEFFNARRFRYTLAYLFRDETLSLWTFFVALARFGQAQGWRGQARKPAALFNGLWRFLTGEFPAQTGREPWPIEHLRALLTFDFYLSGTGGDAPGWLTPQAADLRDAVKKVLNDPAQKIIPLPTGRPVSELRRRMLVFRFGLDPETGEEGCCPVLIYRPAQGRP